MKNVMCLLLFTAGTLFAGESTSAEKWQEIDVYETGRYDFDRDGTPEQIVITSGGGSGGPIWYIARLSGEKLTGEIQGRLFVLKSKSDFKELRIEHRCCAEEQITELYRFYEDRYKCVQKSVQRTSNTSGKRKRK